MCILKVGTQLKVSSLIPKQKMGHNIQMNAVSNIRGCTNVCSMRINT